MTRQIRRLKLTVVALACWSAGLTVFAYTERVRLSDAMSESARMAAVLLDDGRGDPFAGTVAGSDAIRLKDADGKGFLEIGRYNFGWTMLTPQRLEMHPAEEFSISCYGSVSCLPRFQVRNIGDTEGAVWINGNGIIGSQFGPLKFAFGSFTEGSTEIARFERSGDLVLHNDLVLDGERLSERLSALEAALTVQGRL